MMKKLLLTGICLVAFMMASDNSFASDINYEEYKAMFEEPVTESAVGIPQRLSEVVLHMEIISAEDIAKTGARSIPEIFRFIPGMSVKQATFGQTEVSIRGYNQSMAERILVLLDGRQVYIDAYGQVAWDNIPVEISEIRQIEIVKGPNTALFGFNAVSGVINIITKNPYYEELGEVTARVGIGAGSLFETSLLYSKVSDNGDHAVKVSAGGYEFNDEFEYYLGGTYGSKPRDSKRESANVSLYSKLTDNTKIEFNLSKNDSIRNEYLVTGNRGENAYKTDTVRTLLSSDTHAGVIGADIYFTNTRQNFDSNGSFRGDTKLLSAKVSDVFEYKTDHLFRLSAEYREASNMYDPFDSAEVKYKIYSANAVWDWRISNRFKTNAAFRYDYFELSPNGNNVSAEYAGYPIAELGFTAADYNQVREEIGANIGAVYKISDNEFLRGSFATGADLPSFTDFALQIENGHESVKYIGNPYVDTSVITNYELNYDKKFPKYNTSFEGSIFYQETNEMQGFGAQRVQDGGVMFSITGNLGDSSALGIELGLEGEFRDNWDWSANYTYVSIDDDLRNHNGSAYVSFAEYEDSNAEHIANLTLGYNEEKWNANLGLQYISAHEDIVLNDADGTFFTQHADSEFILNAHYKYNVTENLSWSITGQNILGDTEQFADKNAEPLYWMSMNVKF